MADVIFLLSSAMVSCGRFARTERALRRRFEFLPSELCKNMAYPCFLVVDVVVRVDGGDARNEYNNPQAVDGTRKAGVSDYPTSIGDDALRRQWKILFEPESVDWHCNRRRS